ncbi:uncharacterized protein LOC131613326 [Vicia villosa]|uniref:uncharacterized protein LOC131613326 n=1 Tax=Vicia villosa TaxID=3911 RepID=UPI00273CDAEF|nr:uncharacterized protein LOC131613326 [Vicia villosa]
MGPQTFMTLCDILQREGGLKATRWSSVEEQVAKSIYILTHNAKNREVNFWFLRSGETISRHLHQVLRAILELEDKFLVQPDGSTVPHEISSSYRFYLYFKDCVGAIDGTHIRVKVSAKDAPRYRGRKDYPTQNVLAACTFDLKFTYVLAGWEGSSSDSRIIKNALTREDKLKISQGKYYLVDAGFMLTSGLITPYRGVRYHLKEYSARNPPQNSKELFNLRHSSLRNAIERAFDPDEDLIAEVDAELANQNVSHDNHQGSRSDRDELAMGGVIKDSFMASNKQLPINNGNSGTLTWNRAMDDALVDAFIHEYEKGNKFNGTFTTSAYENIAAELRALFVNKIDKLKIKNRWKTLKKNFP